MAIGCKKCGRCCMAAEVWLDPTMDDKNAEFALKRIGAHMMWRELDSGMLRLKVLLRECPHLSVDKKTCLIHDNKPQICREEPSSPDRAIPGCRYYDEAYEEDKEEKKEV